MTKKNLAPDFPNNKGQDRNLDDKSDEKLLSKTLLDHMYLSSLKINAKPKSFRFCLLKAIRQQKYP